ncbi:MAG: leucyl aminopeptidase [Desulfuromonadales bacterium]|nr:leucyl aminopeptidase [Desulfuromonadales bacterium]
MEFKIKKGALEAQKTSCLVLGVSEGRVKTQALQALDQLLEGRLQRSFRTREFTGADGEMLLVHAGQDVPWERVLLVGMGKERNLSLRLLRQSASSAARFLLERKICSFMLAFDLLPVRGSSLAERVQAQAEGVLLADYRFEYYLADEKRKPQTALVLAAVWLAPDSKRGEAESALEVARQVCAGVSFARDLVNQPGNCKSPEYLARQAVQMAENAGIEATLLKRKDLQREGCGGILGVAQGSCREPYLVILKYQGGTEDARPIALVGKGVVFDSGGISLKPAEKMDEMKMDMGGAAAVLGTMLAAARLKLPVNLVAAIPAVENMPSGSAIRPGDILTSLSGKTIEVLNTDAEGRLILADALTYVGRFNPRVVIDVATLTGACIIALGHQASAVLGNHDGLVRQLLKAGERSGERLWQLPLWEEYAAMLKSDFADLKNIGGRPAGTITAAAFLQNFASDYTWAHLDIAGTAWEEKGRPGYPKGGTGFGVRMLIEYLRGVA